MADANPQADLVASGYDRSPTPTRRSTTAAGRACAGCRRCSSACRRAAPCSTSAAATACRPRRRSHDAHAATGIDISREQVERARANVPEAAFLCGDALGADLADASFDAVVSFYMLDHLPREQHAGLFARIAGWLRPGGLLLVTAEVDDEPGMVGEWLGEPMFFSAHDAAVTQELIAAAGFDVLEAQQETQSEGGREVAYVWLLARASALAARQCGRARDGAAGAPRARAGGRSRRPRRGVIPMRSMTAIERTFSGAVNETISSRPSLVEAERRARRAPPRSRSRAPNARPRAASPPRRRA